MRRTEHDTTYTTSARALRRMLPRARVRRAEDDQAVAVPRSKRLRGWHVYVHGPTTLGVYWEGRPARLSRLAAIVAVKYLDGDVDGLRLYAPGPALTAALASFCMGRPNGRPFKSRQDPPVLDQGTARIAVPGPNYPQERPRRGN